MECKIIEELIKPRVVIRSQFQPEHDLPVTQLDWGATSQPLGYVEDRVKEILWNRYGNPHSCGTVTATLTKKIIDDCKTKVLATLLEDRVLDERYMTEFGGEGSTHWLEKIPGWFSKTEYSPICLQRELHNSLIEPWLEAGWAVDSPPSSERRWEWFSRRLRYIREVEKKIPILLLSASSHITGGVLKMGMIRNNLQEGDVVILDTTCYLTHNPTLPSIPFDFAVFSGHKLPGGPGSPGCVVFDKKYAPNVVRRRGTENVSGIVRLTEALVLNVRLLRHHSQPRGLKMMNGLFRRLRNGTCTLLPTLWDPEDIYEEDREPIFSFIFRFKDKLIHPDIIADLFLHLFGMQIRVGGLCSDYSIPREDYFQQTPEEWLETSTMETIFRPSVCRISIPSYLLSESLALKIEEAVQELLTYGQHLIQTYTSSLEGWRLHPDLLDNLDLTQETETAEQKDCGGCPGKKGKTHLSKSETEGEEKKPLSVSKLIPRLIALEPRHPPKDHVFDHPYRWFLHPLDKISLQSGFDDLY